MSIADDNWKTLTSLFPTGWQQMAWQSGAVQVILRASSDTLHAVVASFFYGDYVLCLRLGSSENGGLWCMVKSR
ncbi:MAG TPA: hypothetical protein VNO32_36595 [Candidatus Acidoferrum sp.]|nr:hypothetical protein [Candidatus Acidoferrum sp.]